MKGPALSQGDIIKKNCENTLTNFKNLPLQKLSANFNNTSTKHRWVKFIQMIEGPRLFPKGDNYEIAKMKTSSSIDPLGQFQPNLAQLFLGEEDLSLFKWKDHTVL